MSASLKSLAPNIVVKDVNASVKFYSDVLGFKLITSVPETGQLGWAMVQRDGVVFMFQSVESMKEDLTDLTFKPGGGFGTFFVEVTGVDDLFRSVGNKAEIVVKMRTTFYGKKEFAIKDPDGHIVMFAEDV